MHTFGRLWVETSQQQESIAERSISSSGSCYTPTFHRIDFWARVGSLGPLMADKAGAGGNTIRADEERRGDNRKGSGGTNQRMKAAAAETSN